MAQTPHTSAHDIDKPASKPAPESQPAPSVSGAAATPPESRFSTPPADPAQAPSLRRASASDATRLRVCAGRLEDLQHRVAHLLNADDLAELAAVLGELDAMAPRTEPVPAPPPA